MKRKIIKLGKSYMRRLSVLLFIGMCSLGTVVVAEVGKPLIAVVADKPQASNSPEDPELEQLQLRVDRLATAIRFQYDSTVLPTASVRALDQIMTLMREQGDAYYYMIWVHSYEAGQSNAYALDYADRRADAIRNYLVDQGVEPQVLLAKGMGAIELRCDSYDTPDCYDKNNRLEIVIHRKRASEEQQTTLSRLMDRTHTEYRQVLADILKEYFVGGENTLHLQVNVNPCHITVIETYSYYGNPHIRLWTFSTEHLSGFTMVSQSEMQIMISDGGGMMYDSRSKGLDKLQYITLAGISGDARDVRDQWERAWYYYKQACNEPPRAY